MWINPCPYFPTFVRTKSARESRHKMGSVIGLGVGAAEETGIMFKVFDLLEGEDVAALSQAGQDASRVSTKLTNLTDDELTALEKMSGGPYSEKI